MADRQIIPQVLPLWDLPPCSCLSVYIVIIFILSSPVSSSSLCRVRLLVSLYHLHLPDFLDYFLLLYFEPFMASWISCVVFLWISSRREPTLIPKVTLPVLINNPWRVSAVQSYTCIPARAHLFWQQVCPMELPTHRTFIILKLFHLLFQTLQWHQSQSAADITQKLNC